jgi:hypothetical protein
MPPEARRHLRGHHRREPLETLAVAGYSFSVLVVLSIPLWWFISPMAAVVACIAAAAVPIATGAVVAGIALGTGTGRTGRILLSLGSQLHIAPLVLVVALTAALVLAFRSRRRGEAAGLDRV